MVIEAGNMRAWEKGILIAFAFAIVAGVIWLFSAAGNVIGDAQAAVKATLRDPGSAQFLDLASFGIARNRAVCGKVNAKNGFGGYSGFVSIRLL